MLKVTRWQRLILILLLSTAASLAAGLYLEPIGRAAHTWAFDRTPEEVVSPVIAALGLAPLLKLEDLVAIKGPPQENFRDPFDWDQLRQWIARN